MVAFAAAKHLSRETRLVLSFQGIIEERHARPALLVS
jgi:hypothetical protein